MPMWIWIEIQIMLYMAEEDLDNVIEINKFNDQIKTIAWECIGCGIEFPCRITTKYQGQDPVITLGRTCVLDQRRAPHWRRVNR